MSNTIYPLSENIRRAQTPRMIATRLGFTGYAHIQARKLVEGALETKAMVLSSPSQGTGQGKVGEKIADELANIAEINPEELLVREKVSSAEFARKVLLLRLIENSSELFVFGKEFSHRGPLTPDSVISFRAPYIRLSQSGKSPLNIFTPEGADKDNVRPSHEILVKYGAAIAEFLPFPAGNAADFVKACVNGAYNGSNFFPPTHDFELKLTGHMISIAEWSLPEAIAKEVAREINRQTKQ
jgi:hypothetical protein